MAPQTPSIVHELRQNLNRLQQEQDADRARMDELQRQLEAQRAELGKLRPALKPKPAPAPRARARTPQPPPCAKCETDLKAAQEENDSLRGERDGLSKEIQGLRTRNESLGRQLGVALKDKDAALKEKNALTRRVDYLEGAGRGFFPRGRDWGWLLAGVLLGILLGALLTYAFLPSPRPVMKADPNLLQIEKEVVLDGDPVRRKFILQDYRGDLLSPEGEPAAFYEHTLCGQIAKRDELREHIANCPRLRV